MKINLKTISFFLVIFLICSCKKEDITSPVQGPDNYLEFSIDNGVLAKMYTNIASVYFASTDPNTLVMGFQGYPKLYVTGDNFPDSTINLGITANEPITTKTYDKTNSSFGGFSLVINDPSQSDFTVLKKFYQSDISTSTYKIIFTTFESRVGGKIEGTFEFRNINTKDKVNNGTVLTTGHNVTQGYFKTTIRR